jgi:hypothetical protein
MLFNWPNLLPVVQAHVRKRLETDRDLARDLLRHTCKTEWGIHPPRFYLGPYTFEFQSKVRNDVWFGAAARSGYNSIARWVFNYSHNKVITLRWNYMHDAISAENEDLVVWLRDNGVPVTWDMCEHFFTYSGGGGKLDTVATWLKKHMKIVVVHDPSDTQLKIDQTYDEVYARRDHNAEI